MSTVSWEAVPQMGQCPFSSFTQHPSHKHACLQGSSSRVTSPSLHTTHTPVPPPPYHLLSGIQCPFRRQTTSESLLVASVQCASLMWTTLTRETIEVSAGVSKSWTVHRRTSGTRLRGGGPNLKWDSGWARRRWESRARMWMGPRA